MCSTGDQWMLFDFYFWQISLTTKEASRLTMINSSSSLYKKKKKKEKNVVLVVAYKNPRINLSSAYLCWPSLGIFVLSVLEHLLIQDTHDKTTYLHYSHLEANSGQSICEWNASPYSPLHCCLTWSLHNRLLQHGCYLLICYAINKHKTRNYFNVLHHALSDFVNIPF